jgi:hypothetical protein
LRDKEKKMARQKKVKPYEIDFKFPYNVYELVRDENGEFKYDTATLLSFYFSSNPPESSAHINFADSLTEWKNEGKEYTGSQISSARYRFSRNTPEYADFDKKFFDWYDSRPDIQEVYAESAASMWWFYDDEGGHVARDDAETRGWTKRPSGWRMFENCMGSREGRKVLELKREIKFDVGDMVQLRTPFENGWKYDPIYHGSKEERASPRIGTILSHKNDIDYRSRGGKGSRLLNVLWLSSGRNVMVPERILKKIPKGK